MEAKMRTSTTHYTQEVDRKVQMKIFHELAEEIYPLFEQYQIAYPIIKIRRMRARWGTCQYRKGVIILNSRLIERPREFMKYVLVHEFAHFVQPNHSKAFYKVVEEVMPNWKGIVAHEKENFANR